MAERRGVLSSAHLQPSQDMAMEETIQSAKKRLLDTNAEQSLDTRLLTLATCRSLLCGLLSTWRRWHYLWFITIPTATSLTYSTYYKYCSLLTVREHECRSTLTLKHQSSIIRSSCRQKRQAIMRERANEASI
jgi:hypothetical protein